MDILKDFGIQPTLLLAQIVNFLIILFLLKKFFYKPITRVLEDRKKRIEESLKNADLIEEKLAKTQEQSAQIIKDAQNNAQELIREAKKHAQEIVDTASKQAKASMEESVKNAQSMIEAEKQKAIEAVKEDTIHITAAVIKKVLGKSMSTSARDAMTKEAAKEMLKTM